MVKQKTTTIMSVTGLLLLLLGVFASMFMEPVLRYVLTAPFMLAGSVLVIVGLNLELKMEKEKNDNN